MADAESGEPVAGDVGEEGLQQVAVVNEQGETIYVQLPPNVTLDGNSVVTTETTEDGHQILRILGVSTQQVQDEAPPTEAGDTGVHMVQCEDQEVHTDTTEVHMVQDEEEVHIAEAEDHQVHTVQLADQGVHVIQPEEQEVPMVQSEDQVVHVEQTEEHGVHLVQTDEQGVHIIQPEEQEVHMAQPEDQEVHMAQPEDQGVHMVQPEEQEVHMVQHEDQGVHMDQQVVEMGTEPTEGQEYQVIQVGEDQQEIQVIRVGDEDREVRVIQMSDPPTDKDMQLLQMGTEGGEQQVQVIRVEDGRDGGSQHDLQLFQQAMALIQQQTAAGMVVGENQHVVVGEDGQMVVGADGQVVMSGSEYGGNTVYVVQEDTAMSEAGQLQAGGELPGTTENEQPSAEPPEGTVRIINPKTGRVEIITKTSLDTVKVPDSTGSVLLENLDPQKADPVFIAPVKRGRGRPRKDRSLPPPPPKVKVVEPPPPVEEELPEEQDGDRGRPRRKSAIRFLKSMKMSNQDEERDLKLQSPSSVAKPRSYVRRTPSAIATDDKENVGPPTQVLATSAPTSQPAPDVTDHPASVHIKVKDRAALQVLSDLGIHILYYCRRCTFFSTQLMSVVDHIATCRLHPLSSTDRTHAADAASSLLQASLQAVGEKGGRDNNEPGLDDEQVQIDEHNYAAEVDLVEEESEVEKVESVAVPEQTPVAAVVEDSIEPCVVPCHLCGVNVEFSTLAEHLRMTHSDMEGEEAALAVEELSSGRIEGVTSEAEGVGVEASAIEEAMDVPTEQSTIEVEQSVESIQGEQYQVTSTEPTAGSADPGGDPACAVPANRHRFRCPEHELLFASQADHTRHYMEVHWGVTPERVAQTEAQRNKEREEKQRQQEQSEDTPIVPVKRGRGRPRKYPKLTPRPTPKPESKSEHLSDYDDDVTDPDFEVKSTLFLPRFRVQPGSRSTTKCKFCYKHFASSTNLQKHMREQHTPDKMKPLPCSTCGKHFRNRTQLRNHVRTVHEGKKRKYVHRSYPVKKKTFMCESCGYTTPELIRLRNHKMSVHEGKYPYECTVCDYKTNEKADMRRHEHKHQGIRRYPCQFCTYRTDQRWLLVNHCMRQHSVQLEKNSRNTRGSFWSSRRRRREDGTMETVTGDAPDPALGPYTQEIIIEPQNLLEYQQQGGESFLVPMVTTNEHGEETVTMYAVQPGETVGGAMEGEVAVETVTGFGGEVAVETVGEEEAHAGGVVYLQEDGTILETSYG